MAWHEFHTSSGSVTLAGNLYPLFPVLVHAEVGAECPVLASMDAVLCLCSRLQSNSLDFLG